VYYRLGLLEKKSHITEADGTIPSDRATFWHVLGLEPHLAESRIKETTVSVTKFETVRAHQALCLRPGRTEGRVDQE
jgi:hypothetical protein